ncbi:AAA family ATPase [Caballeronia sp. dw_276]|jgi:predicted ATPase|uniref:ATP-dependent nuclease n=1 Tax=Caballeronia sp. dw_276 TaxID=2719795 RepID=UPI002106A589|nr:AAA family ATPase [Caballeronia sp. dw_276]
MKLHSLKINGFRRIESAEINFGEATFLIGANNCGKSTVFKAIEWLLSAKKQIPSQEYFSIVDDETGETKPAVQTIVLEAEFRNLPVDAVNWRGFKGRIFSYAPKDAEDSGLSVTYRKTFPLGSDVVVEFKSKERFMSPKFEGAKTGNDFILKGVPEADVIEVFPILGDKIGASKAALEKLEQLDFIWETRENETWFQNPGGIPGNVLKMLPRFLIIPADAAASEIEGGASGVLGKTLGELFEDVRGMSQNYAQAQIFLDKLATELDPEDGLSEFGKMIAELNGVLAGVFPDSKLHAKASLNDPKTALRPTFTVEMSSNVRTPVTHQGTGMVRAAAFGMLRFRQRWLSKREDDHTRSLIVCFEEPEIYLHPSAASQMRNTIYELSGGASQIIATTHSPYIIDLSRKPRQILNSLKIEDGRVVAKAFNVTDEYIALEADDKSHVKMLLRVDDYVSRVFFTKNVVIVEGDTEEVLIKESIKRLEKEKLLRIVSDFEIVKARGKASIIGLVKYLVALRIFPIVVHDRDQGTPGAEKFNLPIANAVGQNGRVVQMHENVEDVLGYKAASEKPFRAYQETLKWGETWDQVSPAWQVKMKEIFGAYV